MTKGEHKAIHPFGRIPALEDHNFQTNKLFESRAICRYIIESNHGRLSGKPTSTREVALLNQALSVEFLYFDPTMKKLGYECLFKNFMGLGLGEQKAINELISQLRTVLDYYEWQLEKQEYFGGNDFSLIDIYIAPWIYFFPKINLNGELESRPNLKNWWAKINIRPSWEKVNNKLE